MHTLSVLLRVGERTLTETLTETLTDQKALANLANFRAFPRMLSHALARSRYAHARGARRHIS
jgi:hypothetical protein